MWSRVRERVAFGIEHVRVEQMQRIGRNRVRVPCKDPLVVNGVMRIVARKPRRVRDERPGVRDRQEQEQREADDRECKTRSEAHRGRASPGCRRGDTCCPPAHTDLPGNECDRTHDQDFPHRRAGIDRERFRPEQPPLHGWEDVEARDVELVFEGPEDLDAGGGKRSVPSQSRSSAYHEPRPARAQTARPSAS